MRATTGWMAAVGLLFLTAAGCGGQSAQEGAAPGSSAAPTATGSPAAEARKPPADAEQYTFRLPIAAYSYSAAEQDVIERAKNALTDSCMADFGVAYHSPAPLTGPISADRRYGISSAVEAKEYGYHLPPDPSMAAAAVSPDIARVLYGKAPDGSTETTYAGKTVPANGCRGKAVTELGAKFEEGAGASAARDISVTSYRQSEKDSHVVAAVRKWSACMKGKGLSYRSPMTAVSSFSLKSANPSEKERTTAVADISCKQETHLLDIWFTAESGIQKTMIREHRAALEGLKKDHAANVDTARAVVARQR
ncbi:hypothetical protein [Streptomyces sp. NPDC052107]|uniref:hypothetical protein n=1 Tax=Streptomyces sp. NPDC052107 TaxID=3155632 RepID=UPI00344486A4